MVERQRKTLRSQIKNHYTKQNVMLVSTMIGIFRLLVKKIYLGPTEKVPGALDTSRQSEAVYEYCELKPAK